MKPWLHQSPLSSPNNDRANQNDIDSSSDDCETARLRESSSYFDEDQLSENSQDGILNAGDVPSDSPGNDRFLEVPFIVLCFWCKKVCPDVTPTATDGVKRPFSLTSGDKHFCSEVCFNRCRRATFKKSKICDWCRRVKPAVSYVDFTDGNEQLQFCSDNCLNQYKMHIFCRETEAHLQFHPHLNDIRQTKEGTLITPELWLKNCSNDSSNLLASISRQHLSNTADNRNIVGPPNRSSHQSACNIPVGRAPSRSSSRETSPASQISNSEPVNLSTTHSKVISSPVREAKIRASEQKTEDKAREPVASYRKRFPLKVRSLRNNSYSHKPNNEKTKSRIRVKQLEDRQNAYNFENGVSNAPEPPSPNSTTQTTSNSISAELSHLIFGSTQPNPFSTLPNIFPRLPAEYPNVHPQILPQLLLKRQHLNLPNFKPPFLLPEQQFSPLQQPPTVLPAAPPPPQTVFPCSTVLLPFPLPIPLPVPIPIPFPIPLEDFRAIRKKNGMGDNDSKPPNRTDCNADQLNGNVENKISPASASLQHSLKGNSCSSEIFNQEANHNKDSIPEGPVPTSSNVVESSKSSSHENDNFHLNVPVSEKILTSNKKERRSILHYTSDVYEVNGVFVPKAGTWSGENQLLTPSANDVKKRKETEQNSSPTKKKSSQAIFESRNKNEDDKLDGCHKNKIGNAMLKNACHDKQGNPKKKYLYI